MFTFFSQGIDNQQFNNKNYFSFEIWQLLPLETLFCSNAWPTLPIEKLEMTQINNTGERFSKSFWEWGHQFWTVCWQCSTTCITPPDHRFVLSSLRWLEIYSRNGRMERGAWRCETGSSAMGRGGRHRCTRGASSTERAQSVYSATMDSSTVMSSGFPPEMTTKQWQGQSLRLRTFKEDLESQR